jgi:hypothetical protein
MAKNIEPSRSWWRENIGLFVAFLSLVISCFTLYYFHEQILLDQRAWLGVRKGTLSEWQAGPRPGTHAAFYELVLSNTGKTPALNAAFASTHDVAGTQPYPPFPKPVFTHKSLPVFPATDTSVGMHDPVVLTDAEFQEWREGKLDVFVYLVINYEDIFGNKHKTTFCEVFAVDQQNLDYCNGGNDID